MLKLFNGVAVLRAKKVTLKLPSAVTVKFNDLGRGKAKLFYSESFGRDISKESLKNTFNTIVKVLKSVDPSLKTHLDLKRKTISINGTIPVKTARDFLGSEFISWTSMSKMTLRDLLGAIVIHYANTLTP